MKKIAVFLLLCASLAHAGIGTGSVQTSATGTTYVTLGEGKADEIFIINDTGTALEVQIGGAGVAIPIASGSGIGFAKAASVSQFAIRRADVGGTQVTVKFWWEVQ